MNIRKFSINKACILLGILLLLAIGVVSAAIYLLTENITAVGYVSVSYTHLTLPTNREV